MSELYPSDAQLNALSGTADAGQGVYYPPIGESPYYLSFYKMLSRLLEVARRAGDLRVYKDGDLTFGLRGGMLLDGDTPLAIPAAIGQALTDDATNYVYLLADGTLTISTSGFPTPSVGPHLPLATIVTAGGQYDHEDITDYRGRAILSVAHGISAAQANTLVSGAAADSLHIHGPAGLSATVQQSIPSLAVTGTDNTDGTASVIIQARDAAGNGLAERIKVRTWVAGSDFGSPLAQADFSVLTGSQLAEIVADADYEVISDSAGLVAMTVDHGGAGLVYVLAEIDGRIYSSGAIAITNP